MPRIYEVKAEEIGLCLRRVPGGPLREAYEMAQRQPGGQLICVLLDKHAAALRHELVRAYYLSRTAKVQEGAP